MISNENSEDNKYFKGTLKMIILERDHPDISKVLELYYSSFPKNELIIFTNIRNILKI